MLYQSIILLALCCLPALGGNLYLGEKLVLGGTIPVAGVPAFSVVWSVTNNNTITLPTSGTDNYTVDWGDGTVQTGVTTNGQTHTYLAAGEYTMRITGTMTSFTFNNAGVSITNLVKLLSFGSTGITDGSYMFNSCPGLTGTIPALPAGITDGSGMFFGCFGLTGTIPALPASLVNGPGMFFSCSGLTGTIPALPASLVNGFYMFANCSGLTGISALASSTSLTDVTSMFSGCTLMTGNSIQFYDTSSFPNITAHTQCYYNCVLLSDYATIPSGWK